jgi:hypothetical protein
MEPEAAEPFDAGVGEFRSFVGFQPAAEGEGVGLKLGVAQPVLYRLCERAGINRESRCRGNRDVSARPGERNVVHLCFSFFLSVVGIVACGVLRIGRYVMLRLGMPGAIKIRYGPAPVTTGHRSASESMRRRPAPSCAGESACPGSPRKEPHSRPAPRHFKKLTGTQPSLRR